jgi:diguanylate cyclase (GGDEF)-like protein
MERASGTPAHQWIARVLRFPGRLRGWAVWSLPGRLRALVLGVVVVDLAVLGFCAAGFHFRPRDLGLFAALVVCGAATVELTRRVHEPVGVGKDISLVWEFPVVILLPPLYALIIPVIRFALIQWRVRKGEMHRRVFSAAAVGLAYVSASAVYHAILPAGSPPRSYLLNDTAMWLVAAGACAVTQWVVTQGLVLAVVRETSPGTTIKGTIFARAALHNDATELCAAILVALSLMVSWLTLIIALPLATLLQRAFRHDLLLHQARADAKTGLLNAAAWEREAEAEIARAVRTRTPLAVAILDLDRFKRINDSYGHLLGDEVLRGIAGSLSQVLRDYDLAGRFGGEEFVMLLPQTRAVDALRIAERVRAHISRLPVHADGPAGPERVPVTVSIGVAALDAGTRRELTELLAAADAALYRAKASGRDQVQMISTSRGLSAVRPPAADGSVAPPPAAFAPAGFWMPESQPVPEAPLPERSVPERSVPEGSMPERSLPGEPLREGAASEGALSKGALADGALPEDGAAEPAAARVAGNPPGGEGQLPEEEGNSTTATTSALAV